MSAKSNKSVKNISRVEVTHISQHGLWVLIDQREYFLAYAKFPWFLKASIFEIHQVSLVSARHLRWEQLDVDLSLSILENPEKYPLIAKF